MKIELDRKGLEILVKGCAVHPKIFNEPLVKKAGYTYTDGYGITTWSRLKDLSEPELYRLYQICRQSWL